MAATTMQNRTHRDTMPAFSLSAHGVVRYNRQGLLMKTIRRVAVLGAGTMGARIAAHFANAGIPSLLLDIVVPNQPNRNAAALKGIENAAKQRPGGFFTDAGAALSQPDNFADERPNIADCDGVIEAATDKLNRK